MCVYVDEDRLHEATGVVSVSSAYAALRLLAQPYGDLPGEMAKLTHLHGRTVTCITQAPWAFIRLLLCTVIVKLFAICCVCLQFYYAVHDHVY